MSMPVMSLVRVVVLVTICFSMLGCAASDPQVLQKISRRPLFARLTTLAGEPVTLDTAYPQQRVLMVFWSVACPRSRTVVKELVEVLQGGDPNRQIPSDVKVLAINIQPYDKLEQVTQYATIFAGSPVQVFFSGNDVDDEAFVACKGDAIPLTVALASDHTAIYHGYGVQGFEEAVDLLRGKSELL